MDGIININKEPGYTSHDVVAKLRGILGIRKIGHTGTLDPDAAGVLPICVGRATRVCDVLTDRDKTYEAKVVLGITTDTLDTSGEIREIKAVDVDRDGLFAVLSLFKGEITQIPPMYSAVKVNGKKLYEYAREGKEVERKKRQVTIYETELLGESLHPWKPDTDGHISPDKDSINIDELPSFRIRIRCSKGTYIRTLCDDIGRELGCGACMASLVRTAVGRFGIEDALTLSEVEDRYRIWTDQPAGELPGWMFSIDSIFDKYPSVHVSEDGMKLLKNGNPIPAGALTYDSGSVDDEDSGVGSSQPHAADEKKVPADTLSGVIRVYGADGDFYALYRYDKKRAIYKVEKYFH